MGDAKIPGGYFILARKIINSEIMKKPPLYMKVWVYLLARAQHSQYNQLKRGQVRTSIPEIQEACSWYVGARKQTPTKREIQVILDWMRGKSRKPVEQSANVTSNSSMIVTTKVTHGLIVTIENYDVYQSSSNYERYNESSAERTNETSSNSQEVLQYKQECNKNEQENKDDDWLDIDLDPTPEQEDLKQIRDLYIKRSGRFPGGDDLKEMSDLLEEKIPLQTILDGINYAFSTYKPKFKNDCISKFAYCAKVVRSNFYKKQVRKNVNQQRRAQDANTGQHHSANTQGFGKQTKGKWDHLVIG